MNHVAFAFIAGAIAVACASASAGPSCPSPLKGSKIPSATWSDRSTKPGYYAPDSAVINVGNGQVVNGSASYATVKSKMGSLFAGAEFSLVGGVGTASNLPAGVYTCSYDGPRFRSGGKTLEATVTVACTNSCGSL